MNQDTRSLILSLTVGLALLASTGFLVYMRQVPEIKPASETATEPPAAASKTSFAGEGAVQLTPEEQQKIGLQTGEVTRETLGTEIATAVPRKAVLDTGGSRIVYVARGDGIFESRAVEVGVPQGDKYPVKKGLTRGERVVTGGAFMVYSQTRLTGGMTGMFGGSKSFNETTPPPHKVTFRIDPDPPVGGRENSVHVTVADTEGNSVGDAQVHMTLIMPAMPSMKMPEMRSGADLQWNGKEYAGPISVSMAGPWNIIVEAKRGGTLLGTYRSHVEAR